MREVRPLFVLAARSFSRSSLPRVRGQSGSALLLRVLGIVFAILQGRALGSISSVSGETRNDEFAILVLAFLIYTISTGLLTVFPFVRGGAPLLRRPVLEALPISEGARVLVEVTTLLWLHAFGISFFATLGGRAYGALGLILSLTGMFAGCGVAIGLRAVLSTRFFGRAIGPMRVIPLLTAVVLMGAKPFLATAGFARHLPPLVRDIAVSCVERKMHPSLVLLPLFLTLLGALGLFLGQRRNYDRTVILPPEKLAEVRHIGFGKLEALLARREPGGGILSRIFQSTMMLLFVGGPVVAAYWTRIRAPDRARELFATGVPYIRPVILLFASFLVMPQMMGLAQQATARDVAARPLLAPLPILPSDLLAGRYRFLRRRALEPASTLLVVLAAPLPLALYLPTVAHVGIFLVALLVFVEAAVSVAFITRGVAVRERSRWPLAIYILMLPLLGVATATDLLSASLSLFFLVLVARQARRAAMAVVRWFDDADGVTNETDPWSALVALGGFQASQSVALGWLIRADVPSAPLLSYCLAAVALVGLIVNARGLDKLATRPWQLPLGIFFGLVSATFGLLYLGVIQKLHLTPAAVPMNPWLMAAVFVLVAPVVEEMLFRGWLLPAFVETKTRSPMLFSALLFALIHPPASFVPVFVLGVLTAHLRLRTGGIVASVVAHTVHNGLILFAIPRILVYLP